MKNTTDAKKKKKMADAGNMADLRSRAKVPYGYRIVDGEAYVNSEETARLQLYFRRYLEGESMSAAAKEAQLPCSQTTLPHLFQRKEYIGNEFYPPIITEEYQQKLIAEWEERKKRAVVRSLPTHKEKGVRIYKEFRLVKARNYDSSDPVDSAAALYQRIRPKMKTGALTHNLDDVRDETD